MSTSHIAIAATSVDHVDAIEVPTEAPMEGEVLIKVAYAAMIAFDTYVTDRGYMVTAFPMVLGCSAAGIVHAVGPGVNDLKVGDRVTAFAYQQSKSKAIQQYAIEPETVCAKIPDHLPFEQAVTIPDNFVTAFYSLFGNMGLPRPKTLPATEAPPLAAMPILIYGAGASSGNYAVQLLHLAGYRKIIATASESNHEYLRSLGVSHVFDYRSPTLAKDIADVVGGDGKVKLVLDCIDTEATIAAIAKVISPNGLLAILLPFKEGTKLTSCPEEAMHSEIPANKNPLPDSVKVVAVRTLLYQQNEYLKQNLMPKILPALLERDLLKPNSVLLMSKGSLKERVLTGLDLLRNNRVNRQKVVVKVADL